eukprot:2824069-Amphidinium_carterae.1
MASPEMKFDYVRPCPAKPARTSAASVAVAHNVMAPPPPPMSVNIPGTGTFRCVPPPPAPSAKACALKLTMLRWCVTERVVELVSAGHWYSGSCLVVTAVHMWIHVWWCQCCVLALLFNISFGCSKHSQVLIVRAYMSGLVPQLDLVHIGQRSIRGSRE